MARPVKPRLYDKDGFPVPNFNDLVVRWITNETQIREHKSPAAFEGVRQKYDEAIKVAEDGGLSPAEANKEALSRLTDLLFGHDLAVELGLRLNPGLINDTGFRTTLSQGVAKNVGENFVNLIVYAFAKLLEGNDDVLVDKGLPPALKTTLELRRVVDLENGRKSMKIPIEGDMTIFSRSNPHNAIVISAKTRLKEVFHIGTMWKMFFDMLGDPHCQEKWGLERVDEAEVDELLYVFATADMVKEGGRKSQGPDVEREEPRNLIAMDASFFDYVFVSKSNIPHVSATLELPDKEALFHELGCLWNLVEQKFGLSRP